MITIKHNFDANQFMWLWSKYVTGGNDEKHCTNSLKGKYSKKFSKHNEQFNETTVMTFDEVAEFKAIYICGVIKKGYYKKANYPHNVHIAIVPAKGKRDVYEFDGWKVEIENGRVERIIEENELPVRYQQRPEAYTTCRIFRWMIGHFYK